MAKQKKAGADKKKLRFDDLTPREIERFSEDFLSKPSRQVAREWGISDYSVRNWAKRLGLDSDIRQAIEVKTEIKFAQDVAASAGLSPTSEAEIVSAVADIRARARLDHRAKALLIQEVSVLQLEELKAISVGKDLLLNLSSNLTEEQAAALQAVFSLPERAKALANVTGALERGINAERKALNMDRADADEAKDNGPQDSAGFMVFVPEKESGD